MSPKSRRFEVMYVDGATGETIVTVVKGHLAARRLAKAMAVMNGQSARVTPIAEAPYRILLVNHSTGESQELENSVGQTQAARIFRNWDARTTGMACVPWPEWAKPDTYRTFMLSYP